MGGQGIGPMEAERMPCLFVVAAFTGQAGIRPLRMPL
jgi:hypothetical protein